MSDRKVAAIEHLLMNVTYDHEHKLKKIMSALNVITVDIDYFFGEVSSLKHRTEQVFKSNMKEDNTDYTFLHDKINDMHSQYSICNEALIDAANLIEGLLENINTNGVKEKYKEAITILNTLN